MSDHEKLTAAITIKLTDTDSHAARMLAASQDMELSEYIRHLILQDKHLAYQRWISLNEIFGQSGQADKGNLI